MEPSTNPSCVLRGLALLAAALALPQAGCGPIAPSVAQLPPAVVTVGPPVVKEVADYYEFTGQTAAVEEVEIRARVSGYLVKIGFADGQEVKQGDLLFEIDPRPYEADLDRARGESARAQAMLAKASADLARSARLRPSGAITQEQLDQDLAQKGVAEASVKAANANVRQAELNLEFTKVVAPIHGRISRANITVGNLIQPGPDASTVLTTLVSVDPIYVYFDVDERTMLRYQQLNRDSGRDARLAHVKDTKTAIHIGLANEEGFPHQGMIDFVDNRVDPGTGTIRVRGVFPNADRALAPGLFVRVRLPFGDPHQALLVSERALGTDQGQKFVYVVDDENKVVYRPVKVGSLHEGLRVIQEGLKPGERVIINGVQRVRPGVTVDPQPGEMLGQPAPAPAAKPGAAGVPASATSTQPQQ